MAEPVAPSHAPRCPRIRPPSVGLPPPKPGSGKTAPSLYIHICVRRVEPPLEGERARARLDTYSVNHYTQHASINCTVQRGMDKSTSPMSQCIVRTLTSTELSISTRKALAWRWRWRWAHCRHGRPLHSKIGWFTASPGTLHRSVSAALSSGTNHPSPSMQVPMASVTATEP